MDQPLYGIWIGDVFFCFSGEMSEPKVDAWMKVMRRLQLPAGIRPFAQSGLRLAELKSGPVNGNAPTTREPIVRRAGRNKRLPGRMVEGLALSAEQAYDLLLAWDEQAITAQGIKPGGEMVYWQTVARFARKLLRDGKIVPDSRIVAGTGRRSAQASLYGVWKPLLVGEDREIFAKLAEAIPMIGLSALSLFASSEPPVASRARAEVLHSFLVAMMDAEIRRMLRDAGYGKFRMYQANYRRGTSPQAHLWWNTLYDASSELAVQGTAEDMAVLEQDIRVHSYAEVPVPEAGAVSSTAGELSLVVRLEPPQEQGAAGMQEWRMSFWAGDESDPAVLLPAALLWRHEDDDLMVRGRTYQHVQRSMLSQLGQAAECSPIVRYWIDHSHPVGGTLEAADVYAFLKNDVPRLRKAGIIVQIPSRWTREGKRRTGLKLKVKTSQLHEKRSPNESARLGMEQMVSFEPEAVLDGRTLSSAELAEIVKNGVPLIQLDGGWVEVDLNEIKQVLRFIRRHEEGEISFNELMHIYAEEQDALWNGLHIFEIETNPLLSSLMEGSAWRELSKREVPEGLHGTLRPYQERGFQWLATMRDLGFGACLADDMGLGKTVQVITCMLDQPVTAPRLIVCPTSLLGNWQRELERFAPDMQMYIHHGSRRPRGEEFIAEAKAHDIVLTTYHLAGRDGEDLRQVEWSSIVLDEAQYIKNYRTKQAQSVMKLNAPHRIAMTGTPVENRLSELWSIFQFLNPGYLGTSSAFRQTYNTAMGPEAEGRLSMLRKLVAPFMLRRLKSDPDIRRDLPDKIELKSYCYMTVEQASMYQSVVSDMLGKMSNSEGITRKGIVLSSLTKLKQICDHPYLIGTSGKQDTGKQERSGKMARLIELLDMIRDSGEAALVFTQYVEMGELLTARLGRHYGQEPFFLHGGVSKASRDEMIGLFQQGEGPPIFVLSLKAGGVGLNLTRANHVIHYDRWWNPAVENQATDRVFRIGQQRNVQVHKLICQGTLEERIDELIESKKTLAEQVVGAGEQWLTEMSDEELKQLVSLQAAEWGTEE
ncbi:DEAD/DEAH box helicase [Paenibacillus hunanensis]|uniref:DEAD/DEAH box helicase n=1 Tax=Paenibacillus hunanensis TaxID=539262 RepID=UPI0020266464|nr:DEAD/DEAH box helicase [Paenibacillus hunanensis]MCL9660806.1 DEAD/DEAH box helicase [Paenibacillus hunanensis]